jgi:hypothetical protein
VRKTPPSIQAPRRAVRHLRRSCDLSSLTNSAAHSRASGILPASLNARAFAKAWLSDRRSAADSFPGRAPWAFRSAVEVLRIATDPIRFQQATNLGRRRFDRNVYPCRPAPRATAAPDLRADRSRTRGREGGCRREVAPPPTRRAGPRPAHAATNRPPLDLAAYRAGLADPSRPGADL